MKNIAIILASGSGSRFESRLPKQFVRLAGKPVIQYALETLETAQCIDEVIIVTKSGFEDLVLDIINVARLKKVSKVIAGGKERYDSTLAALRAIKDTE